MSGVNLKYVRLIQHMKIVNIICIINKIEYKTHVTILIDTEKSFVKN